MPYSSWQVKKIYFYTRNFLSTTRYILNKRNEQGTSFVNTSKRNQMMESGAPLDKFGVLHCLLPIELQGFTSRIDFYHSFVPGLISIF